MSGVSHGHKSIRNFGKNIFFSPKFYYRPRTSEKVIQILNKHRKDQIRVIGSLHSWSAVTAGVDAVIDLRHFDKVTVGLEGDTMMAMVVCGCTIGNLLDRLQREEGYTLPSHGAATKQTIAGAMATGTHASDATCRSDMIEEIHLATFNPDSGDPGLRILQGGEELQARILPHGHCPRRSLTYASWSRSPLGEILSPFS